jgi:Protein of unknown function (DUF1194)
VSSRAAVFGVLVGLTCAGEAAGQTGPAIEVDAEIVLAVDASRSMDMHEFDVQRAGYVAALRHPDLIRAITAGRLGRVALSYFEWAGEARDGTLIPWRVIESAEDAAAMAGEIAAMPVARFRGTSISRALQFATVLLDDDAVEGARRIIDVSGDGANNTGPPVTGARDAAVAGGITVNGLPIIASVGTMPELDIYYEDCVIGGDGAFVMVARSGEELAHTIRRKLILEVSGGFPEPRIVPADFAPTDCMIGEKQFRNRRWDMMR